jgi:hypothetical protein
LVSSPLTWVTNEEGGREIHTTYRRKKMRDRIDGWEEMKKKAGEKERGGFVQQTEVRKICVDSLLSLI